MNKTFGSLCVGLLVIGSAAYAMDGKTDVVKQVAKEAAQVVAKTTDLSKKVSQDARSCKLCPIRVGINKAWMMCKKHPVCIAAGLVAVAIVIAYNIPAIKEKVNGFLGFGAKNQEGSVVIDHSLPQEKVETTPAA